MKTIKVAEATNNQLNWLVAKCEGKNITLMRNDDHTLFPMPVWANRLWRQDYTTSWSQMGPIIGRERINMEWWHMPQEWHACMNERLQYDEKGDFVEGSDFHLSGPTPLIAAARCYVVSKLGDTVEVPEELT